MRLDLPAARRRIRACYPGGPAEAPITVEARALEAKLDELDAYGFQALTRRKSAAPSSMGEGARQEEPWRCPCTFCREARRRGKKSRKEMLP